MSLFTMPIIALLPTISRQQALFHHLLSLVLEITVLIQYLAADLLLGNYQTLISVIGIVQ